MSMAVRELRLLARDPILFGLVVLILAALLVFVLYPILLVLWQSFTTGAGLRLDNYHLLAERRLYPNALRHSLGGATPPAALSAVIGYLVGSSLSRTGVPRTRVPASTTA